MTDDGGAGGGVAGEYNALTLDLKLNAARRARHRGRGDMAYLLARVRRELETRWAEGDGGGDRDIDGDGDIDGGRDIDGDGDGENGDRGIDGGRDSPRRVLVLDFADSDLRLSNDGDVATMHRVCALESPAQFEAAAGDGGFDGVVICLQAAWLAWPAWPRQLLRALSPGGRLVFCTFGPDTLREARAAWAAVDDAPHVHDFLDMHHIGDELLRCGYQRPIVDADWVTVNYPGGAELHADLRAEGFANIASARRKTLTGKARLEAYQKALDEARAGDSLPVTFELIYGVATAPAFPARVQVAPGPSTQ